MKMKECKYNTEVSHQSQDRKRTEQNYKTTRKQLTK